MSFTVSLPLCAGDKVIDGRTVEARIEELQGDLQDFYEHYIDTRQRVTFMQWLELITSDPEAEDPWEAEELLDLLKLQAQAQQHPSWPNCTLINEDHWQHYAQDMAEDNGLVTNDWPSYFIDWERAAAFLRQDYAEVRFGSSIYLVRQ